MTHIATGTQIQPGLLVSVVDGLVDTQKGTNNSANDPLEALIAIRDLKEKTLILLRDFHLFLQDPNPILIRQLKDVLQDGQDQIQDPHHPGLPYGLAA